MVEARPRYLQKYLDDFNKEIEDTEETVELTGEAAIALAEAVRDDDDGCADPNSASIIVDSKGNYYFQPCKSTVTDQTPAKKNASPTKLANKKSGKKLKAFSPAVRKIKTENLSDDTLKQQSIISYFNPEETYEFNETIASNDDETFNHTIPEEFKVQKFVKLVDAKNESKAGCFICPYCPYSSHKKFLLTRHLNVHTSEKGFQCTICERKFKTRTSLMNHYNTHAGVKPHKCPDCDRAFTTSGELIRHTRYKHTGYKPHKCTECSYASVEFSKLRRHMTCHTGEREFH